jgi:putative two-component system response regulator
VSFAAVSLPRRAVAGVAASDILALMLVAAFSGGWPRSLIFTSTSLVVAAAVCASIAGDRWQRNEALQETKEEMLRRLARVIEYRDNATGEHVERMSAYCAIVARHLGWLPGEAHELRTAATMHDVGKVAVPDRILLKPGPLTLEERLTMERHTVTGHEMLAGSRSPIIQQAADIALSHHERWDGGGYPHGLPGPEIPVAARIVALADVFDALTSNRVYRQALPLQAALALMEQGRGTQFDPQILDAFLAGLEEILAVRTDIGDTSPRRRVLLGAVS